MHDEEYRNSFRKLQIGAVIIVLCMIVALAIAFAGNVSVNDVMSKVSGQPLLAIIVLLILFALKSMTVFLPLWPLYVASGLMFPPIEALVISFVGTGITLSLPYSLGRWAGGGAINIMQEKYPKVEQLVKNQNKNLFFVHFLVRLVVPLPFDIVSLYFGACKATYSEYLVAGLLGSSLAVITETLMGDTISDPTSKEFLMLVVIRFGVVALSLIMAVIAKRRDC